jgi:integrase
MGFGRAIRDTLAAAGQSAANARNMAERARALIAKGIDPIEQRDADREAARTKAEGAKAEVKADRTTLARVARAYHEKSVEPRRTTKHAAQWIASLEQGVPPAIWHKPIADVTPHELLDALGKLQARVPETASRVRQRLEVVFDDAIFHRHCTENPARIIKRKLAELPKGRTKGQFAALPYIEGPAFTEKLRTQPGIAARALEFALLRAARTGEVIGATWGELDLHAGVWRVRGERMKGSEDHTVFGPGRRRRCTP